MKGGVASVELFASWKPAKVCSSCKKQLQCRSSLASMELNINKLSLSVDTLPKEQSVKEFINNKTTASDREDVEDPFYVVDLGRIVEMHERWTAAMPRVTPFYAVKCNEDIALLKTLAALGTGFDCASKHEMRQVLDLGVSPERVIYANPCKQPSHIQYAARRGVVMMSFDNTEELDKILQYCPTAKLVLRIKADAPDCVGQPGFKFGCTLAGGKQLLDTAKTLGLNVIGISFHVGSRCQTPSAYEVALTIAAQLFEYAAQSGHQFTLLDMGGGFPGHKGSSDIFHQVSSSINGCLDKLFSPKAFPNLNIIAEPGRYFACSTHTIAVNITSKRSCDPTEGEGGPRFMYYVTDGTYGSFNCLQNDRASPQPLLVKVANEGSPAHESRIWGETCAGRDKVCDTVSLPELKVGDWLYFEDMGAYTISSATNFNGFPKAVPYYYVNERNLEQFKKVHGL